MKRFLFAVFLTLVLAPPTYAHHCIGAHGNFPECNAAGEVAKTPAWKDANGAFIGLFGPRGLAVRTLPSGQSYGITLRETTPGNTASTDAPFRVYIELPSFYFLDADCPEIAQRFMNVSIGFRGIALGGIADGTIYAPDLSTASTETVASALFGSSGELVCNNLSEVINIALPVEEPSPIFVPPFTVQSIGE